MLGLPSATAVSLLTKYDHQACKILTCFVSHIILRPEETHRVSADRQREMSRMDITALTFVTLPMLMLVFLVW